MAQDERGARNGRLRARHWFAIMGGSVLIVAAAAATLLMAFGLFLVLTGIGDTD